MTLESQIVQALDGALVAVLTAGIAYGVAKLKALIGAHVGAKNVANANSVVDSLATIANNVVAEFNQSVVADAKASGKFDAAFAQRVKDDAIAAVKSQAMALGVLGVNVAGDVNGAISSAVEKAVVDAKSASDVPSVPSVPSASPTPVTPDTSIAPAAPQPSAS